MTITTEVRINHPVNAVALLDHVTEIAGGNVRSVRRGGWRAGELTGRDTEQAPVENVLYNQAGQGLRTLAGVKWAEGGLDTYDDECPPALVSIDVDNPYGGGVHGDPGGRWVQANEILPAIVEWLDANEVPRTSWWWNDESAGTWHPGTTPVQALADEDLPREHWTPPVRDDTISPMTTTQEGQ